MGDPEHGNRATRHARSPLVADVVSWTVHRQPVELAVGRWVLVALEGALDVATASGGAPELPSSRPRVPLEPSERLSFNGPVTVHGTAPWLPRAALGAQDVSMDSRTAWLTPAGASDRTALPLSELRLASAVCRDRYRHRRRAGAAWSLEVSGLDAQATITGPWLALAWLGHLAGWPEPG